MVKGRWRDKSVMGVLTLLVSVFTLALWGWAQADEPAFHIVSDGTAKYAYEQVSGWETLGFDDSAWQFVVAPSEGLCGTSPVPPGEPNPIWGEDPEEFQTIFVRKTFSLPAEATAYIVAGADDDYDLYINGVFIGGNHDGYYGSDDLYTGVPLQAGLNVIAMEAVDTEGGCQSVRFDIFPPPTPPENDDLANAQVISALPFTDMRDTRGATPDGPEGCYGAPNNVWYTLTLNEDTVVQLNTEGSTYYAFVDVFELTEEGAYNLITCDSGLSFTAEAGKTYYIAVSSPDGLGKKLVLSALNQGTPLQIDLRLNATGYKGRIGRAIVGGKVICDQPAEVDLYGELRQKFGRRRIVVGNFYTHIFCDGRTPWSETVQNDQWAFGRGRAELHVDAYGYNEFSFSEAHKTRIVRIQPALFRPRP